MGSQAIIVRESERTCHSVAVESLSCLSFDSSMHSLDLTRREAHTPPRSRGGDPH